MMLINAEAVLRCAIERRESRGAHSRTDYPKLDPGMEQLHMVALRAADGSMRIETREVEPVPYNLTEVISQSYERYTPEEIE
jgi:succinate dehydrogenase/fumarate reductase flavoprotein subunit